MTTQDMTRLAREISEKKRYLSELITSPVDAIAQTCARLFNDAQQLDEYLQQAIQDVPHCALLYVSDRCYRQVSSNIDPQGIVGHYRGQDLSQRPYLQATVPLKGLVLSNSYVNPHTSKSCISLVQAIQQDDDLLGLLIADFNLHELPAPNDLTRMMSSWHQFKGDPAIRDSLFSQQRIGSYLDTHINDVHAIIRTLLLDHGVFHFKLHYSSSRVTLWLYDQPHHYRLHSIDDVLNGTVAARYSRQQYPADACVDSDQLQQVLDQFRALRFVDDTIYLRAASINIINGMVGLNFSCDGSHYLPVKEFINNSMDYWLGTLKTA